jgi:hypothetical protein
MTELMVRVTRDGIGIHTCYRLAPKLRVGDPTKRVMLLQVIFLMVEW